MVDAYQHTVRADELVHPANMNVEKHDTLWVWFGLHLKLRGKKTKRQTEICQWSDREH